MANELDKSQDEMWLLKDLPVTSENIGFRPEEMNGCSKCGKSNPPTRPKCFYCSADLLIDAAETQSANINSRVLENREKGFNLVYLPESSTEKSDISAIARLLSIEVDFIRQIIEAKSIIPLVRLESPHETAIENLSSYGMKCCMVADEVLEVNKLPVRLRGLKFLSESFVLINFNTDEEIEVQHDDLSLIVTGALFEAKTETVEKRKKKEASVVLETQAKSDSGLIDIYVGDDAIGYRITVNGFDFSCLGSEKGLLAAENIRRLAEVLRSYAKSAKFAGDYLMIRQLLDEVWPLERRKDSYRRQGTGLGGKDFTNIESSNNLQQFTKYSRLQRQLL